MPITPKIADDEAATLDRDKRYISRRDVARRYGISNRTVRRWEERPGYPTVIMIQGRGYVNAAELEERDRRLVREAALAKSA